MNMLGDLGLPSVEAAIAVLREFAELTRGYAADVAVVFDDDKDSFRVSVDTKNNLIIVHGGTLPFFDAAAALAGGLYTSYTPSPELQQRINAARATYPHLLNFTLGISDHVNALTKSFIQKLEAELPVSSKLKIAAAAIGAVALAVSAFVVHRHYTR